MGKDDVLKVPSPSKELGQLSDLKKRRASIKTRLTLLIKYVSKYEDQPINKKEKAELKLRIQTATEILGKFYEVQDEIEGLAVDDKSHFEYRENFEDQFYSCLATAQCIIEAEDDSPVVNLASGVGKSIFKLPHVKLSVFDGSYDTWLEFMNSYVSMIHNRTDLDPIHKFHYLKSSLTGTALQVISALEFTASNYNHAWELLIERFHNHRLLVHNHVKALFTMQQLNRESPTLIRTLIDTVSRNLRALQTLNEPTESWDTLIIYLLVSKLDLATEREWESFKSTLSSTGTKLSDLLKFLRNRADMLDMVNANNFTKPKQHQSGDYGNKKLTHTSHTLSYASTMHNKQNKTSRNILCVMCGGNHALYTCIPFLNLSINDRIKFTEQKGLCRNCLRSGHSLNDCFFGNCMTCQRKHNSLLHTNSNENNDEDLGQNNAAQLTTHAATTLHSLSTSNRQMSHQRKPAAPSSSQVPVEQVLLSTALVYVADVNNKLHTIRAVFDSGSMHCFLSERVTKLLNVKLIQSTVRVSGVGQSITHCNKSCEITLQSKINDYKTSVTCFVLPCITSSLPSKQIDTDTIRIPENYNLADPTYFLPGEIDLLIGADKFWELLEEGNIRLINGPFLQNTKLGWLISGPLYTNGRRMKDIHCNFTIDDQLQRFWELEEIPKRKVFTDEELQCEDIFLKTTSRDHTGRFSVRMPLKESPGVLGDSYKMAENRFLALEKKLNRFPEHKKMYSAFLNEYQTLGHMSKLSNYGSINYFVPHHGVFRESSSTTKLRVVFDASAVTSSNKSLNDIQLPGPKLQNDVFSILLRFRQYKYVACADIEKFFRQISIQPDQRMLQLILWRESASDHIQIYCLNTVSYGTVSAPFLSMRCLRQLAQECENADIAQVIREDFYVDDLITGKDDKQELLNICEGTSKVLKSGCFPLRKWTLNFDVSEAISKELSIGEHTQNKTLGLGWQNDRDELYFSTKLDSPTSKLTKRIMLSIISQIYDPLGLLAPVVILFKILLQKLWLEKLEWDDPVGQHIVEDWNRFINTLQYLSTIKIPRWVSGEHTQFTELHIFTDASENAYGACAYVRTYTDESEITVRLLCAKSKVCPLKRGTIARLELCAAHTGARLYKQIIDSLRIKFNNVYLWSDSTIVLGWLRLSPHLLNTFVQNRVTLIKELTLDIKWLHVKGKDNPADLVSRGLYLDALKDSTLWWNGPSFLHDRNTAWENVNDQFSEIELPELKAKAITLTSVSSDNLIDFNRFSSFIKLKRVGAYILRFIFNIRVKIGEHKSRKTGPLSTEELLSSQRILIRLAQQHSFPSVVSNLLLNKSLININSKEKSRIAGLNVFIDDYKIVRVGGRLCNASNFGFDKKHPVLLCCKHRFTRLLFIHEHTKLMHAGPQLLLAQIRECWWPLGGRNLAKMVIKDCVKCTRLKGITLTPMMGNLPSERLDVFFPFYRCGVDYCGPILYLNRKGRGSVLVKGYICLFICFITRAIHLELVSGLSSNDYLLALKRFVSRRGKPLEIFSDNGKNFVGAEKEFPLPMTDVNVNQIVDYAANDGITFKFIPPRAAHFGGLWEAGIKSCKHHLRRVVGNAHLTFEEFSTILVQIEAVLNSRPLSPMSPDPSDLTPLTPAHFLIGRPLTAPACRDLTSVTSTKLGRYHRIEQLRQHFWRRWSTEYISELQTRTKWKTHSDDIQPNIVVLIKEDNTPPLKWRMGRVLRTYPGRDGVSRVADIQTTTGIIRRAFSKICPIPTQEDTSVSEN